MELNTLKDVNETQLRLIKKFGDAVWDTEWEKNEANSTGAHHLIKANEMLDELKQTIAGLKEVADAVEADVSFLM